MTPFPHMNKAEFTHTLETEHAHWQTLLRDVGMDCMDEALPGGSWTVKDIVAHIMSYEQWMAGQLNPELRADAPAPPDAIAMGDVDQRNEWFQSLYHSRAVEDVLAEAGDLFMTLLSETQKCSEEALNSPMLYDAEHNLTPTTWNNADVKPLWPLWKWIANQSYEHYHQHMPTLKAWLLGESSQ